MRALLVALFLASCAGHEGMTMDLRDREVEHHQAMMSAPDLAAARAETADYAADMRMMMMDMDCPMMGDVEAAIADHQTSVDEAPDLAGLRAACEEHRTRMEGMFDAMDGMM